jgi:hypothetical protein
MSIWSRLLNQTQILGRTIVAGAAQFHCAVIAHQFAAKWNISIDDIPPEAEQKFLDAQSKYDRLRRAIRGVEDHTLGVSFTGSDVDILATSQESAIEQGFGAIPLIIAGVIVVAGAIAVSYWATQNAIDTINQARALVQRADVKFCKDPNGEVCSDWNAVKSSTEFVKHQSLADTIKSGISGVGSGIALGVLALIGIGIFLRRK